VNLSPHFTDAELDVVGAPAAVRANAAKLAQLLEGVRAELGVPLRVTSGYRSPDRNSTVGGAAHSQHMDGTAADFVPVGLTRAQTNARLKAAAAAGRLPAFGQLILYPYTDDHVHLSLPRGTAKDGEVLNSLGAGRYVRLFFARVMDAAKRVAGTGAPVLLLALGMLAVWLISHVVSRGGRA
jgi:zinc D-Ala-D-Ala carboxypeptidase